MLRLALSFAAAAAVMVGTVSARTVRVADLLADRAEVGSIQFAGGSLQFSAPQSPSGAAIAPAAEFAIAVDHGFMISNLRFNSPVAGRRLTMDRTLLVNDIGQRFADVGGLTFTGPTVSLRRGGADPAAFTLEAFDVDPVVTPIPGAAVLLMSGLAGLGFAMGRGNRPDVPAPRHPAKRPLERAASFFPRIGTGPSRSRTDGARKSTCSRSSDQATSISATSPPSTRQRSDGHGR